MGAAAPEQAMARQGPDRAIPDRGGGEQVTMLPVAAIAPSPNQPRRQFDEQAMTELVNSILMRGILQPILVRPAAPAADGAPRYEIVAGERRWRAAQLAARHEIPAVVRAFDDSGGFEAAIIENVQREDLNPIEEAMAYDRLIREFGHSQFKVADMVGKSRSHIANLLRLLDLPDEARALVQMGVLSQGHAKAALSAADPLALAREIVERGLSVRQAEEAARRSQQPARPAKGSLGNPPKLWDADREAVETMLADALGMRVAVSMRDGKSGAVTIRFSDLDQLDELIGRLQGQAESARR